MQELAQPASFGAAMDDLHAGEYSFGNSFRTDTYTSPSTTLLYATPDASRRGSHASAFDDAMETDPTPTSVSRNATQSTAETATSSWTSDTTASYHTARSPSDTRSATSFIPASSTARLPSSSSRSQPRQTSSYATPAAATGRANGRSRSQSRPRTSDARTVRFPTPEEEPVLRMPGSYVGSGQGWHSPEVVRPQVTRMASQGVLGLGGSKSNCERLLPCSNRTRAGTDLIRYSSFAMLVRAVVELATGARAWPSRRHLCQRPPHPEVNAQPLTRVVILVHNGQAGDP